MGCHPGQSHLPAVAGENGNPSTQSKPHRQNSPQGLWRAVTSDLTDEFVACYRLLPQRIREQARRNKRLWKSDPHHPRLDFKLVGRRMPIYSVRVGIGWRALGVRNDDTIIWFWIGAHAEYDRLLQSI